MSSFRTGSPPPTVSTNPLNRTASQGPIFHMSASEAGAYRIQTITTNLEPHGDFGRTCDIIGNAYRFQVSLGDRARGGQGWKHYVHIPI